MIVAIIVIAVWVALFLPVAILPLLPKVDNVHTLAPSEFVRRAPKIRPSAPQEQAA